MTGVTNSLESGISHASRPPGASLRRPKAFAYPFASVPCKAILILRKHHRCVRSDDWAKHSECSPSVHRERAAVFRALTARDRVVLPSRQPKEQVRCLAAIPGRQACTALNLLAARHTGFFRVGQPMPLLHRRQVRSLPFRTRNRPTPVSATRGHPKVSFARPHPRQSVHVTSTRFAVIRLPPLYIIVVTDFLSGRFSMILCKCSLVYESRLRFQ